MAGLSAKLPLQYDSTDGPYALNKTLREVIKQNLKMLILTNPGERVADTQFGVGVKRLLFENRSASEVSRIRGVIKDSIKKYLSYIQVQDIVITTTDNDPNLDENLILISISYFVPTASLADSLTINVSIN